MRMGGGEREREGGRRGEGGREGGRRKREREREREKEKERHTRIHSSQMTSVPHVFFLDFWRARC